MAKKNNKDEQMDAVDYMDKIGDWVEKNSKIFIVGFAALVLGVGAFWSYSLYESQQIQSAAKMSGMITRKIELLERAIEDAKNPDSEEFKNNLQTEIKDIQNRVSELSAKYPSKSLTDLALIKVSGFLESRDQIEESLKILEMAKVAPQRKLSGVLLLLKAKVLHRLNKDAEALAVYDKVVSEENWKSFHAEALIQKALLNKKAGDFEAAENNLEKAKALNESGAFFEDAEKYLRLIQYKKNQSKSKAQNNG
jgi:predicted negative regulator of RcsB-dependent stress response